LVIWDSPEGADSNEKKIPGSKEELNVGFVGFVAYDTSNKVQGEGKARLLTSFKDLKILVNGWIISYQCLAQQIIQFSHSWETRHLIRILQSQ
jgi:hypothetical protein